MQKDHEYTYLESSLKNCLADTEFLFSKNSLVCQLFKRESRIQTREYLLNNTHRCASNIIMSSTYTICIQFDDYADRQIEKDHPCSNKNPSCIKAVLSLSNHCLSACLRP